MKILVGFLFLYTVTANVVMQCNPANHGPPDDPKSLNEGVELYVYDDDNLPLLVDMKATYSESASETQKDLENRVVFHLYTRRNRDNPEKLLMGDAEGLERSQFNTNEKTVIVTHGWSNSKRARSCTLVRDAFLEKDNYNIIVVDWSRISKKPYLWASNRVLMVAKFIAKMIDFLESQGMRTYELTLVGHSLGGHIAGLSAYYAKSEVNHVVALDPALPNFGSAGVGARVSDRDASFVQVIHTNAGFLGYKLPIGHADYFPNGGTWQEGCGLCNMMCAHSRAYEYYAESINTRVGFGSRQCDKYNNFQRGTCDSNHHSLMGGSLPDLYAWSKYYLKTNGKSPFAMGPLDDYQIVLLD